jgi:hypothetical protein
MDVTIWGTMADIAGEFSLIGDGGGRLVARSIKDRC